MILTYTFFQDIFHNHQIYTSYLCNLKSLLNPLDHSLLIRCRPVSTSNWFRMKNHSPLISILYGADGCVKIAVLITWTEWTLALALSWLQHYKHRHESWWWLLLFLPRDTLSCRARGLAIACRPSVCLWHSGSGMDHIGWKYWELIARTISPQHLRSS